jgi:NADH-quinone oxidoreductase subunit I
MVEIPRGKVITVERGGQKRQASGGVLKAMGVVWQHWQGSFRKNRSLDQIHGTFTQEYPEEKPKLPESYRNLPVLLFDDATGHELCTSCFQCQRICPPQVIHMTQAKDPATGKAVPAVAEFVIEYDACMSCGFCAEVCPFDAIKMDHEFELSTDDQPGLTMHKEQLNRPVSYYERIAPNLWAEAKEGANKKLQATIKRRPGMLGVAGDRITEARKAAEATEPEARKASQDHAVGTDLVPANNETHGSTPVINDPAPSPPAASAEDKAAKLAAIRAANAAKKASAEAEPPAPEPAAPGDDKAARLAAIRAANAAKKASAEAEPPAPEPAAPGDDKAARLAAIRAANAAKKAAEATPAEAAPATPVDEKAARLAAIRAANAAKKAAEEQSE